MHATHIDVYGMSDSPGITADTSSREEPLGSVGIGPPRLRSLLADSAAVGGNGVALAHPPAGERDVVQRPVELAVHRGGPGGARECGLCWPAPAVV